MKPSWDFAPEWANYMAKDDDDVWWYEHKPIYLGGSWYCEGGRSCQAGSGDELSLEKRPTKE